jgi:hypothetical protein
LVSFQPGRKDFAAYLELVDHLETILARRVDLVTTEGLSRHLAASVLAEALDVALGALTAELSWGSGSWASGRKAEPASMTW